jgi:hypothetical protein
MRETNHNFRDFRALICVYTLAIDARDRKQCRPVQMEQNPIQVVLN